MCESEETSREHAPPLCLFPDASFGRDLRKNLITVPSCDLHNSGKSKDDEYLRAIILMNAETSVAGRHLYFGKLMRAVARTPHAYNSFFLESRPIDDGKRRAIKFDRERFDQCVDKLTRAIYFHTFAMRWPYPVAVVSPNLYQHVVNDQVVPHDLSLRAIAASQQFLASKSIEGQNPEIFRYIIGRHEPSESFTFAALFYECFEIFVFSSRELANLGAADDISPFSA